MKNLCLLVALVAAHFYILPSLYAQQPLRLTCSPGSGSINVTIQPDTCFPLVAPIVISWAGPDDTTGEITITNVPDSTKHIVDIPVLKVGEYNITVINGNQCSKSCQSTVIQAPTGCPLAIKSALVISPACYNAENGSIRLDVVNAEGDVTFNWNDGSTEGPERTGLSGGYYEVTISDENDCQFLGKYDMPNLGGGVYPYVLNIYPDSSFAIPRTGGFEMGSDGGTLPFSIRLINPGLNIDRTINNIPTNPFIAGELPAGVYTYTLTDSLGCQSEGSVTIPYLRIIPPGELFILEHADNITPAEYNANLSKINEKAIQKKACRCGNGSIEYLQLWESKDTIELLTSGDGSTTKTRPDTSGLSQRLIDPSWLDFPGSVTTPPCYGTSPNPKSIVVALIDSGSDLLSPRRPDGHEDLDEVHWSNRRISNSSASKFCPANDYEGYDFVRNTGEIIDEIGHGTHLAGILKYTAPKNVNLQLMNLKVCSPDSAYAYSVFDLVCAIHYAVDSGAQVINLSLGYSSKIPSLPLYNALKRAEMANIPVVVSAGNSRQDLTKLDSTMRWPVFFKRSHGNNEFQPLTNLLVVTSINDANSDLDTYANYGRDFVDIATVGNYYSTYSYYNTAGVYQQDWQSFKGTSQAAAYASSVIGTIKAHLPAITPAQLFRSLAATHQPVPNLATKLNIGGLLNAEALFKSLSVPVNFPKGIDVRTRLSHKWLKTDKLIPGQTVIGTLQHKGVKTVLNNVNLIIKVIKKDGSEHEIHRRFYCATDTVEWTLPNPVPNDHDYYFAILTTNGVAIGNRMKLTKVE